MTEETSHLFYQSRNPRPFLAYGKGIYLFDEAGKRYIDGSSGAMVSNIGHSNPRVLAKMKAQMDKATFGYRLHFRTHPSEDLAAKTAAMAPEGLDRVFFVSGGSEAVESAIKLARQYAVTVGQGSTPDAGTTVARGTVTPVLWRRRTAGATTQRARAGHRLPLPPQHLVRGVALLL